MKRRFAAFLLAGVLLCTPASAAVSTVQSQTIVRVGLAYDTTAMAAPQLQNVDGTGYDIGTMNGTSFSAATSVSQTRLTIKPQGTGLAVLDTDSGQVLYQTSGTTLAISPRGTLTWFNKYKYRGDFVYTRTGNAVTVVNYVGLEDYIKGVIPYEMSASWPKEALKAQAVCARSYADGQMDRHKSQGFDVCNSTHCQVYKGANSATANSDAAVDETQGKYIYENDKKVVGYFFSSDGGATESSVNVWGGNYAYLTGKVDPYENTAAASNGVWSVTLTAAEVQSKLQSAGYSIGTIQSVQVTKRTAVGNVNELTITDTSGKQVVLSKDKCRTALGLNSIRYTVNGLGSTQAVTSNSAANGLYINGTRATDGSLYAVSGNGTVSAIGSANGKTALTGTGTQTITTTTSGSQTTMNTADPAATGASYTFSGTGWGHGVGMSQYGAKAMAEQGYTYDQILQFYFTGVTVK